MSSPQTCESDEKPEVGRLVDSSQADDRRMIRLVRERKLLYARSNMPVASFYAQVRKLWAEVAKQMGWTVADVRRKWSHVRNSYSRHLRNEMHGARTGRGRAVSRWYLADELEFLREHMATDTRPITRPSLLDMERRELDQNYSNPWFAFPPLQDATGNPLIEPKQEPHSAHDDDSSSSQAFDSEENSSYFQFFRGIYHDYLELLPRHQRLFRRQCLHFLHELLDEAEYLGSGMNSDKTEHAVDLSHEPPNKICVVEHVEGLSILPNV